MCVVVDSLLDRRGYVEPQRYAARTTPPRVQNGGAAVTQSTFAPVTTTTLTSENNSVNVNVTEVNYGTTNSTAAAAPTAVSSAAM